MTFARGLSNSFMAALLDGHAAGVLAAWRHADLDVRIRQDAITAYDLGRRVGHLRPRGRGVAFCVHTKYLGVDGKKDVVFQVDGAFLEGFTSRLAQIRAHAAAYAMEEERVEDAILRVNREPPFVALDRQVQVPGVVRRMDLVGVADGAFAIVEIKRDLDNRIQEVPRQLSTYVEILDPQGGGLRSDVAASYRRVCAQRQALGLQAPPAEVVEAGMPVVGLVVLARYNPRSELLDRARASARGLRGPLHLLQLPEGHAAIPSRSGWEALG